MKKMKRLQAFLLSAILVFSLVFSACDGATSDSSINSLDSSVESSTDRSEEIVATGTFYTLEEAYEKGLLTKEDLQKIADVHNSAIKPDLTDQLSDELAAEIKEAYAKELREQPDTIFPNITSEKLLIYFFGFFNDNAVVSLTNVLEGGLGVDYDVTLDIDGVIFKFTMHHQIKNLVVYVKNP